MQFFSNLLSKVGLFILFLFLELLSFYFIATESDFHKNAIGRMTMNINGYFSEKFNYLAHYKNLPLENENLINENAELKNKIALLQKKVSQNQSLFGTKVDSTYLQSYSYQTAEIVDYSIRRKDNYFLINKGLKDGVKPDMGVLSSNGIVGVILNSSNHYSDVLSILHSKSNIKARVKGTKRFGIIVWNGGKHTELSLTEIPKYLKIAVGDTVVTAGKSAVYPEGEPIRRITKLKPNDVTGDFDITVTTFDDLAKVRDVYVVENLDLLDIKTAKEKENVITE